MDNGEREEFLSAFRDFGKAVFVAFAVCGGMFSEGVDLTGDQLSGAVIIGTGLPQVCFERGLIRSRFDASRGNGVGFDYAYTYPGLNKVFQAGGRVIRTADDRGFILLADDRFLRPGHSLRIPESWQGYRVFRTPGDAADAVERFFGEK
jgi:Rad3-related DNA helicase